MNEKLYKVLLAPHISEKAASVGEVANQYVFKVSTDASKADIKNAVEKLFEVTVTGVRTVNNKGKTKVFKFRNGRRSDWKKAYVSVKDGDSIDFYGAQE